MGTRSQKLKINNLKKSKQFKGKQYAEKVEQSTKTDLISQNRFIPVGVKI